MTPLIFAMPDNERFADRLTEHLGGERADATLRSFPDGESYIRINRAVEHQRCVIVATLDRPDSKVLPLWLMAETLRDLDAASVGLVAPYLAYMRQDKRFQPGEGVTSRYFAQMMSEHVDWLATVDPHLHRYDSLGEVYSISTQITHAAPFVADWLAEHIENPLVIGPDEESEQWVRDIAGRADAPHVVLEKKRRGDRDVKISIPKIDGWTDHTPVLVDDIISTARTMAEAAEQLQRGGLASPLCIGVHAIFAADAEDSLHNAGVRDVVTTDTIPHPSNEIRVEQGVATAVRSLMG